MTVELTIDDKIHGYKATVQPKEEKEIEPKEDDGISSEEKEEGKHKDDGQKDEGTEKEEKEPNADDEPIEPVKDKTNSTELDEYGNEIQKGRMYTEEEVQQKIRDRLARGHHAQQQQAPQQQSQQRQQASEGFEADPDSNESWEMQLEAFIDRRLETREKNAKREQWERQEESKQFEFETKFTTGMEKYSDFKSVVGKLPITDSIMMATREMKDPAAFLYAAAKTHPAEIERIASLHNPIHQATEIGRLEEKMKKAKNISNSARPLSNTKSDYSSEKVAPKRSIDDLIVKHAKSKVRG